MIFSRKKFHYEGRIHEQVVALDGSEDYETYQALVTILHSGYDLPEGRARGVNSYLACYNIGVIYECLGQMTEAERYYNRCGGYTPAEKRLENIKCTARQCH